MPDNFDRHKGYSSQAKPSQDQRKQGGKPKPTGDRGPYFLPKLLGQEIAIHLLTGQEIKGKLKGFNSYELLIEPANSGELSLVFRSAIANVNFSADLVEAAKNKMQGK
jgi:sRNA-binding regulator protein Hfq